MPLYNFATYAEYREEWAIEARDLDEARRKIGTDVGGDWLNEAIHIDGDIVECRDDFYTGADGETPEIEEINPDHWAYRNAHRQRIEHSLRQNIAAISGELHRHRLFDEFYESQGERINGGIGLHDFCIAMAQALTDWEIANGLAEAYETAGVPWIEVVEDLVDTILDVATDPDATELPDPVKILPTIQVLAQLSENGD